MRTIYPVTAFIRWDEKAGLHGMRYAPNDRRARGARQRRPAMKKISTVATNRNEIFKEPKLTIGLDLGDRTSHYCILDEAGNVILEHRLPTTPKGIYQVFSRIPRSRIALETGTHSPWVSRQLTQLGHEVIVAHARNVRLIGESSRKDDQLDARTLARLARIDPGLLGPVRQGSVSRGCSTPTSEGSRNADCVDLRSDPGRSTPLSPQPGCGMFPRVASRAQELWYERTTDAHQQGRRPVPKDADGARRALHSRAIWAGQRPASLGTKASRTRRKECQETGRCCGSSEVGCTASQVVGEWGSLRATAEQPQRGKRSGVERDFNSRAQPPSSGDCD